MPLLLYTWMIHAERYMMPCLNKKLFGFECPGCGLQRSVLLLFDGEFVAAFQMYPAIYTLIPLVMLLVVNRFSKSRLLGSLIIGFSIASVVLIITNYVIKLLH